MTCDVSNFSIVQLEFPGECELLVCWSISFTFEVMLCFLLRVRGDYHRSNVCTVNMKLQPVSLANDRKQRDNLQYTSYILYLYKSITKTLCVWQMYDWVFCRMLMVDKTHNRIKTRNVVLHFGFWTFWTRI